MGVLTLAELKTEVRAALGGRRDLDARLTVIINLAQMRLARIHDFDEMEIISTSTIQNTGSTNDKYLILPNKREVYSVVILNGAKSRKLTQRTAQYWDRHIPMPEYFSRNIPSDYMIWGSTVEIWPLPDATYTIRIRWTKWPTALSADTDVSEFENKDDVLIMLSVSYALRSLGKGDEADAAEGNAIRMLGEGTRMDDSHPDINITPGESDSQVLSGSVHDYWANPFVKE